MAEKVRIFHAVDVHGSELVWRKWLNIPKIHNANILLFCGDLTGKLIVPVVEEKPGHYKSMLYGRWVKAKGEKELNKLLEKFKSIGFYPHVCSKDEYEYLKEHPEEVDKLFHKYMVERLDSWLNMVEEKLPDDVMVVVMPGNDDAQVIDETIKAHSDRVIYPLGKAVNLCFNYEMLSFEWVNPTPWNTPREAPEEKLWEMLEDLANKVTVDWDKVILNFHCPPFGTEIDLAPKLDKNLKPVTFLGEVIFVHVGSKSVRKFIEQYQPMLGLHGHIHESSAADRVGKTLVINPGSEYSEGILRGFLIDLTKDGIEKWWKIEG